MVAGEHFLKDFFFPKLHFFDQTEFNSFCFMVSPWWTRPHSSPPLTLLLLSLIRTCQGNACQSEYDSSSLLLSSHPTPLTQLKPNASRHSVARGWIKILARYLVATRSGDTHATPNGDTHAQCAHSLATPNLKICQPPPTSTTQSHGISRS